MPGFNLSRPTTTNEVVIPQASGTAVTVSALIGRSANTLAQRIGVWGMCFLGFAGGWTAHKAWPTAQTISPISATQPAEASKAPAP